MSACLPSRSAQIWLKCRKDYLIYITVKLFTAADHVLAQLARIKFFQIPPGSRLGSELRVRVGGALTAPHFVLGKTSDEQWRRMVKFYGVVV